VHVLDVSELPLKNLCERLPDFPVSQIHQTDFFQHAGSYDLVLEQTLFCAIDPSLRGAYAKKVAELLVPGGKYVGVLFNFPLESGPPYGGDAGEYNSHFSPWFAQLLFQECHNSIPPRAGRELFARLKKA
jgi:thiopurine S-methyltransferase